MTHEVVAILDAPKRSGMGMHGILLNSVDGLKTAGLRSNRPVGQHEYADLLGDGHIIPADGELPLRLLGDRIEATGLLWVGEDFAERASEFGLPAPIPPLEGVVTTEHGHYWFDFPPTLFAAKQRWLKNALRSVATSEEHDLARLMLNVDATSDFTRAAILHTSDDQESDLRWFLRLDRDAGIRTNPKALRQQLQSLVTSANPAGGLMIALVAHANHGSHRIGTEIASASRAPFCAFRTYFRTEALRLFEGDDRTAMVHAGEIVTTYRCPEAIVETAILSTLSTSDSGAECAVIDGLRHKRILEALRKVPRADVRIAAVTDTPIAPTPEIKASMSQRDIERSETESEITQLCREAFYHLPQDRERVTQTLLDV